MTVFGDRITLSSILTHVFRLKLDSLIILELILTCYSLVRLFIHMHFLDELTREGLLESRRAELG